MKEIKTKAEFEEVVRNNEGYVIITDTVNPDRIHRLPCDYITLGNFEEKVIKNRSKNGHYYWTNDIGFCSHCCDD